MASKTLDPIDILLELGIDLDDLSEQDYLSALMEAIATIEFQTKGKGDERSAALREEVIKIRKGKRKPQAKKTKISADMLRPTPKLMGTADKINPSKLLPPSQEESTKEPEQDSIIKILTDISESVKSILYSLKASNNISKNLAEDERKRRETKKRTGAENKLEKKRFEGLKKIGNKLIEPIKGPLDALFTFLKNVILGRIVIGIIDWLGNPENQKKLESLGRFFMDWWPTIVTAVLLFGTGLGGLLKSIVGITFKFIPKLLGLLPGLLKFLKSPMGRIAGLAVGALGVAGIASDGGEDDVDLTKQDPAPAQTTPVTQTKEVEPEQTPEPMREGGMVPGKGPNKDTVPAMLAPGEFVMSRGAVQKYGAGMLGSMNAAAGGTNRPDVRGGVTYAAGGGEVGIDGEPRPSGPSGEKADHVRTPGGDGDLNPDDTGESRLGDLMKSTDPKKIAAYDAKHGQGAYRAKLKEKLGKIYSTPSPSGTVAPKPTGQVVGRENLSPEAQAAIARLESKRGLPPDMQYTRNGKRISAEEFNRSRGIVDGFPGLLGGGGGLDAVMEQAKTKTIADYVGDGIKSLFGITPKRLRDENTGTVRDGNIGTPTAEEQKAIDRLNATRARADKLEAQNKAAMNRPKKRIQDDPLFAEYMSIQDNPHHPLFEKVRGGGDIDDFGMTFADFKKFKAQPNQAKLSPNQSQQNSVSSNISPPSQPPVTVITAPQGQSTPAKGGGGGQPADQLPTFSASGDSRDRSRNSKILGIF